MADTPLTPEEYAANLRTLLAAAELGPVAWAGPIHDVDEWLAGNQQRTDEHGDAGLPGYCIQSSDGEIIVAFTGTGPHAAAYAELIAYLLNGGDAIAATLDAARPAPDGALRFDHDGTWRHHHHYATNEPIWWENVEQFGGEKRHHVHQHRAARRAPDGTLDVDRLIEAENRWRSYIAERPTEMFTTRQLCEFIAREYAALAADTEATR